jgi:xanthine/uracil/vitamin C permease (AzgA family)
MPPSLVMAVGAGIGLFIAFVGLCELFFHEISQLVFTNFQLPVVWESLVEIQPISLGSVVASLNVIFSTHNSIFYLIQCSLRRWVTRIL